MSKKQVNLITKVQTPAELDKIIKDKNDFILIIEAYAEWTGPTKAMDTHYQRYSTDYGSDKIRVLQVNSALVPWMRRFHQRSRPAFVLVYRGIIKDVVVGLNIPKFDRVLRALRQLEVEEFTEFDPTSAFQELNNDQQFQKSYHAAVTAQKETHEENKKAKIEGREIAKTPDEAFNEVVFEFTNKWQILKQFTDVRIQECVGTLSVDVQADEGFNNMHTGHYTNYGLYAEEKTLHFKRQIGQITQKEKLHFVKKVEQRFFDQQWVLVCFDYSDTELFEEMARFYTQVMSKFQQLYYVFCVRGIDETNKAKLETFYWYDNINIVADKNKFVQRIFNTPIIQDNYEEVFDEHFMSACFIFDYQGKLLEQHANAMFCRSFCFAKLQATSIGNWPEICYDPQFKKLGYKGCNINILQDQQDESKTSSCIIFLHPYSEHLDEVVDRISQLKEQYASCRFILNFEEIVDAAQVSALVERCELLASFVVIQDLPAQYKFKPNQAVISKYDVEPLKNSLISPANCFQEGEELTNDVSILIQRVGQFLKQQKLEEKEQNQNPEPVNEQFIMTNILYCQGINVSRQVFTLNEFNKYLYGSQHTEEYFASISSEIPKQDVQPEANLQIDSDMTVTFNGYRLKNICKPNQVKQKQQVILSFINDNCQNFPEVMFDLYKLQIQYPEIFIVLVLQNVINMEQVLQLKNKFFFVDSFNIQESRPGLNEYFQTQKAFDSSVLFLFSEKMEKTNVVQNVFQMTKILSANDKKSRATVFDVEYNYSQEYHTMVKELQELESKGSKDSIYTAKQNAIDDYPCGCLIFKGVPYNIIQATNPFTRQDRIVIGVFNEGDQNFLKNIEYFSLLALKHPTVFLLALICGLNSDNLNEKLFEHPILKKINIASDSHAISLYTLLHDGIIQPRSFEVYQKRLFDCSCTIDSDLQEIVLDYSGTKWESGLKFQEKNLPFLLNSNLRNFKKQGYILSFFNFVQSQDLSEDEIISKTISGIERYYKQVILPYHEIYFAICISHITKDNMYAYRDYFQKHLFNFNEINIVANIDNACETFCSGQNPIIDEAGNQELFEESACYIFDKQDALIEKHANAYDARNYCANEFHSTYIRQIPGCDKDLNVNTRGRTFNIRGHTGQFLQRVSFPQPKNYSAVIWINLGEIKDQGKLIEEIQQIVDLQQTHNCYVMLCPVDMNDNSWKEYMKSAAAEGNKDPAAKEFYTNLLGLNVILDSRVYTLNESRTNNRLLTCPKVQPANQSAVQGILLFKRNHINTRPLASISELEEELQLLAPRANSWTPESDTENIAQIKQIYKLECVDQEAVKFTAFNLSIPYIQKITTFQYPDYCLQALPANLSLKQFRASHPPEKWICYCYLNSRHERFSEEAFNLMKIIRNTSSLYFVVQVRDVLTAEDITGIQNRFAGIVNCNVIAYLHGHHQFMRERYQFQGVAFYTVYNEFGQREFLCAQTYELRHYISDHSGVNGYPFAEASKVDESKDVAVIENNIQVEGVSYDYLQKVSKFEAQNVFVAGFVNPESANAEEFQALAELQEQHPEYYLLVVLLNTDAKKLKELAGKIPQITKLNVAADNKTAFGYLFDPITEYVGASSYRVYGDGLFDSECPTPAAVVELLTTISQQSIPQASAEKIDEHRQSLSGEAIGPTIKKKKKRTTNKESSDNMQASQAALGK